MSQTSTASSSSPTQRPHYSVQSPSGNPDDHGEKATRKPGYFDPGRPLGSYTGERTASCSPRSTPICCAMGNSSSVGSNSSMLSPRWRTDRFQDDEDDDYDNDDEKEGAPYRRYFIWILVSLIAIGIAALVYWSVSLSYGPRVTMKTITFEDLFFHTGLHATTGPTMMLVLNSTVESPVASTPLDLKFLELTLARGNMDDLYPSKESQRNVNMVVTANNIPLYGARLVLWKVSVWPKFNADMQGYTGPDQAYADLSSKLLLSGIEETKVRKIKGSL